MHVNKNYKKKSLHSPIRLAKLKTHSPTCTHTDNKQQNILCMPDKKATLYMTHNGKYTYSLECYSLYSYSNQNLGTKKLLQLDLRAKHPLIEESNNTLWKIMLSSSVLCMMFFLLRWVLSMEVWAVGSSPLPKYLESFKKIECSHRINLINFKIESLFPIFSLN